MVGFKREGDSAFNIGVGGVLDPAVTTLGEGLEPNAPIPGGDAIRFVRRNRWACWSSCRSPFELQNVGVHGIDLCSISLLCYPRSPPCVHYS